MKEFSELSFSIAASSSLKGAFQRDLNCPGDNYIPNPSELSKAIRQKRRVIEKVRRENKLARECLAELALLFQQLVPELPPSQAINLAVKTIDLNVRLFESGAIYGDRPFNFCLTPIKIGRESIQEIEKVALNGFNTLLSQDLPKCKSNIAAEEYAESIDLVPNGARVDIVLTETGPKIVEINTQWVDAIQALAAFNTIYGRRRSTPELAKFFSKRKRLGIIDITSAKGSRKLGSRLELEILAKNLKSSNFFETVEIIDPKIVRLEYLRRFDGVYINGEPKMINTTEVPDWFKLLLERAKAGAISLFPNWNPRFDRKQALVLASQASDAFVPTFKFSEIVLSEFLCSEKPFLLKGDGYSSQAVALSGTPEFSLLLDDAIDFPNEYVFQPQILPIQIGSVFAYDTSLDKPVLLLSPFSKFNVWVINGNVTGIMVSVSENLIISDKDFNTIPQPL